MRNIAYVSISLQKSVISSETNIWKLSIEYVQNASSFNRL